MRPRGAARGFTLIEVLIALAIAGALLATLMGGLRVGLAVWRQGDARADTLQRDRSVSQLVVQALAGAYPYRAEPTDPAAPRVAFEGAPDRVAFVTSSPPLPGPADIAFTAVSLSVDASGLSVRQRVLPAQDLFHAEQPALTEATVVTMRVRYRRPDDATWQDHWDGWQERSLPSAVEVALTTEQGGRRIEHPPLVVTYRALTP
jgi:general secretion pathway protein J